MSTEPSCCHGEKKPPRWKSYIPLLVIVSVTLLAATARQLTGEWNLRSWMHDWMGFFLVVFAMLKLFDLKGFTSGFQKYDLLAMSSRTYAMLYPFFELGLGLLYLSGAWPMETYLFTAVLMTFGAIGVIIALRKGLNVKCACLGSFLEVPLSTVALTEDLGMAAMAIVMLVLM
jgi:hypothetical protein